MSGPPSLWFRRSGSHRSSRVPSKSSMSRSCTSRCEEGAARAGQCVGEDRAVGRGRTQPPSPPPPPSPTPSPTPPTTKALPQWNLQGCDDVRRGPVYAVEHRDLPEHRGLHQRGVVPPAARDQRDGAALSQPPCACHLSGCNGTEAKTRGVLPPCGPGLKRWGSPLSPPPYICHLFGCNNNTCCNTTAACTRGVLLALCPPPRPPAVHVIFAVACVLSTTHCPTLCCRMRPCRGAGAGRGWSCP